MVSSAIAINNNNLIIFITAMKKKKKNVTHFQHQPFAGRLGGWSGARGPGAAADGGRRITGLLLMKPN